MCAGTNLEEEEKTLYKVLSTDWHEEVIRPQFWMSSNPVLFNLVKLVCTDALVVYWWAIHQFPQSGKYRLPGLFQIRKMTLGPRHGPSLPVSHFPKVNQSPCTYKLLHTWNFHSKSINIQHVYSWMCDWNSTYTQILVSGFICKANHFLPTGVHTCQLNMCSLQHLRRALVWARIKKKMFLQLHAKELPELLNCVPV